MVRPRGLRHRDLAHHADLGRQFRTCLRWARSSSPLYFNRGLAPDWCGSLALAQAADYEAAILPIPAWLGARIRVGGCARDSAGTAECGRLDT